MSEFLHLPEILTKFRNFLRDICPKNARILHNDCLKNIFPEFWGGHVPPARISYAYGSCLSSYTNGRVHLSVSTSESDASLLAWPAAVPTDD